LTNYNTGRFQANFTGFITGRLLWSDKKDARLNKIVDPKGLNPILGKYRITYLPQTKILTVRIVVIQMLIHLLVI